jgi:hypothetical protein
MFFHSSVSDHLTTWSLIYFVYLRFYISLLCLEQSVKEMCMSGVKDSVMKPCLCWAGKKILNKLFTNNFNLVVKSDRKEKQDFMPIHIRPYVTKWFPYAEISSDVKKAWHNDIIFKIK